MKIFCFFLFRKSHLPLKLKKKKKLHHCPSKMRASNIHYWGWQLGGVLVSGRGGPIPTLVRLFFSIPKPIPFKKLNGTEWWRWENSQTCLIYILFLFLFFIFYFCFFIILKLIYFIKNKNIMIFYKLFIKKHSNYYYYLY